MKFYKKFQILTV